MEWHLYRVFFLPSTNVATFITGGGSTRYKCEGTRRAPVRGHLYRVVDPTSTNEGICTRGKNIWYNEKSAQDKCLILW
jgi:hypothetical protein